MSAFMPKYNFVETIKTINLSEKKKHRDCPIALYLFLFSMLAIPTHEEHCHKNMLTVTKVK